ncbi:hypothetical protein CEXT_100341 [Caerostris extrusa]|uniref:Uncharacterized protein n=1 Tax=Caerostris extrusa TaxID=172846 RepID=A0AAV4NCJ7_CAEEX|nr:hypothetical protein CEXT_100341 [Caerostris extrusa]
MIFTDVSGFSLQINGEYLPGRPLELGSYKETGNSYRDHWLLQTDLLSRAETCEKTLLIHKIEVKKPSNFLFWQNAKSGTAAAESKAVVAVVYVCFIILLADVCIKNYRLSFYTSELLLSTQQ